MNSSLQVGKPFGIKVTIHWTFLILIGWIVFVSVREGSTLLQMAESVAFVLTIFGCVVLHELGHALAARRYGINTRGITLLPIGGVASLDKIPEEPPRELFVAIAGPMVNVAIAGILFLILKVTGSFPGDFHIGMMGSGHFLTALFEVNVLLVLFNLIPAFPMDGGRLFRAGLAFRFDRLKATTIAARTGQLIAVVFAIWGGFNNPFLIIIGLFVFIAAQAELREVQSKSILAGRTISDILMRTYTPLRPDAPLKKVVEILLSSQEEEFVVTEDDKIAGILTKNNIISGLSEFGQDVTTDKVMRTDFITVHPDDLLKDVYDRLQHSDYKIVPVVAGDRLTGLVLLNKINEFIRIHEALRSRRWFGISLF